MNKLIKTNSLLNLAGGGEKLTLQVMLIYTKI